jgi:hypothetical protein
LEEVEMRTEIQPNVRVDGRLASHIAIEIVGVKTTVRDDWKEA